MEPRFIVIIPFYNASGYIRECLDSVLMQSHSNWMAICTDDGSDDGSSEQIPADPRIIKIVHQEHRTTLENITDAIVNNKNKFRDEDIVCVLDGDDKLLRKDALEIVAGIYRTHRGCLLTYGNLVASTGVPIKCNSYTHREYDELRKKGFRFKQLRTFKWKLYKEFMRQDPTFQAYKDSSGSYFAYAQDVAVITPLAEIAGFHNIEVNKQPIYWYRRYDRNNDVHFAAEQDDAAHQIMTKSPFVTIFEPTGYRLAWSFFQKARMAYHWMKARRLGKRS